MEFSPNEYDNMETIQYPIAAKKAQDFYSYIDLIITNVFDLTGRANMLRTIYDLTSREACNSLGFIADKSSFFKDRYYFLLDNYEYKELRDTYKEYYKEFSIFQVFNDIQHSNEGRPLQISSAKYRYLLRYVLNMIHVLSGVSIPRYLSYSARPIQLPKELKKPMTVCIVLPLTGETIKQTLQCSSIIRQLERDLQNLRGHNHHRERLKNVRFNLYTFSPSCINLNEIDYLDNQLSGQAKLHHNESPDSMLFSLNEALNEIKAHIDFSKVDNSPIEYLRDQNNEQNLPEYRPILMWFAHGLPVKELDESSHLQTLRELRELRLVNFYPMALTEQCENEFKELRFSPHKVDVIHNIFSGLFDNISEIDKNY